MKLDIGCGGRKQEGFLGVDQFPFEGVDYVFDLNEKWPFEDGSVDEIYASHVIEHFNGEQRVHIANEMYRVMKPGAKATIICPHWSSCRAYGDFTHAWPPIGEFWFYYLSKKWRLEDKNAPHTDISVNPKGYSCDFDFTWGYSTHPKVQERNREYQDFAILYYKEAVQDIYATLTRR